MSRGGGEVPDALLAGRIRVGIVGAEHFAVGRADFVFAAALLAVVAVLVQGETVVARAQVGADGVAALLLAAAVVDGALVHVGEVDGGEARLLHRIVRREVDAQHVALRRDGGRQLRAAEDAVLAHLVVAQLAPHLDVVVLAVLLVGHNFSAIYEPAFTGLWVVSEVASRLVEALSVFHTRHDLSFNLT